MTLLLSNRIRRGVKALEYVVILVGTYFLNRKLLAQHLLNLFDLYLSTSEANWKHSLYPGGSRPC
jgi:hypothetical protein